MDCNKQMGNAKSRMLMADLTEYTTKFGNKIRCGQFSENNLFRFNDKLYRFNWIFITESINSLDLSLTVKQNWCIINLNCNIKCFYQWAVLDETTKYLASTIINKFVSKKLDIDYRAPFKLHLILPVNYKSFKVSEIPENLKNEKLDNIINSLCINNCYLDNK